jgi:tetratricopeptide (TPR) repeat protein
MDGSLAEARRLQLNVEWALQRALDPATVLPMLHRLSRVAPDGSEESLYAQRRLAELLADHHPWRAALSAKRVLALQPSDDGAWAILALCHALLGNYRCAVSSYTRALTLSPANAAYAHNLGHLLDVALGRPKEALPWLQLAYTRTQRRPDVAVSLTHALARAGAIEEAKQVSRRAIRAGDSAYLHEHVALAEWLAGGRQGVANEPTVLANRPPAQLTRAPWKRVEKPSRHDAAGADGADLESILARGLASLPLDEHQRARAQSLAQNPSLTTARRESPLTRASVAAAVAYAIVFVDRVPLTQAEVAACFRVSVPALRGQFRALRARVDLTAKDARVATD